VRVDELQCVQDHEPGATGLRPMRYVSRAQGGDRRGYQSLGEHARAEAAELGSGRGKNPVLDSGVTSRRLSSEGQVPMKQPKPRFSIEADAHGILRIVITRPNGSQIVMPAHSAHFAKNGTAVSPIEGQQFR
jgi:hypothetical protein